MNNDKKQKLELLENWLLHSGIQDQSNIKVKNGGVYAWFDKGQNSYSFLYSEITGYALTWHSYQFINTKKDVYLSRAKDASAWLIELALDKKAGGVLCRHDGENWREQICAFCNGMVLNGLCNYYKISKDKKVIESAESIGNCMLNEMQRDNGSFYSKYDPNIDEASNPGDKWSLISGAFLIKLAIGLLNLADITGNQSYKIAAIKLCDWGLETQNIDGRFSTSPNPNETFLHPHCYAAEGLITAGIVLNEKRYLDAAQKAVSWISNFQLDNGAFPSYYSAGIFQNASSPDMTAQVLRLWLMLKKDQRPKINLSKAIQSILNLQCNNKESSVYGGIMAGDAWFTGTNDNPELGAEHINSWVSMFSAQAIRMSEESNFDPFHMV